MAEVNPQIDTDRNDIDAADKWAALLRDATKQQQLKALQLLLNQEADINITDKDGTAPLHIASMIGCPETVENLLNRGAWVNLADCNNSTPLYYATKNRHERTVKVLLEHGAKFDPKDSTLVHTAIKNGSYFILDHFLKTSPEMISTNYNNRTLLHTAVSEGQLEVVKVLLDHGADINAKDEKGQTPLFHAVGGRLYCGFTKKTQLQIFQLLVSRGADINASDDRHRPLLHRAIEEDCEEIVLLLLKNNVAVNAEDYQGMTALSSAVDKGLVNIAKKLLVHGACINSVCTDHFHPGYTPLHFACQHNSEELCKLLIDNGADVNACTKNYPKPIHVAIQHTNTNIVKLLLKHGAQLEAVGYLETILPCIIRSNRVSLIALILKNCPEVISLLDAAGCTPLHHAAAMKQLEVANLFLKHKANVDALDRNGQTPLFYAVLMDKDKGYPANAEIVKLLISRGANVNVADKDGSTPLHVSVQHGYSETSKVLLDSGARVTARTKDGKTALHFAERLEVARILLEHDADVDARDKDGHTALHIMSNQSYSDVVPLLLENGSDVNITNADGETPLSRVIYPRWLASHGHSSNNHNDQTIRTLREHICRMIALDLYVNDENRITSNDTLRFYGKCRAEVEEMKKENISNTDVSFYSLLSNQKGIYCENHFYRNTRIARALELGDYKLKFPLYSNIIEQCLNRAQKRKVLLYRALNSLNFLAKCILPEELFEEIFQYLSNSDLKNLIYATPDNLNENIEEEEANCSDQQPQQRREGRRAFRKRPARKKWTRVV